MDNLAERILKLKHLPDSERLIMLEEDEQARKDVMLLRLAGEDVSWLYKTAHERLRQLLM
jgi:hypothetical protein